jgi:hypothetical protein
MKRKVERIAGDLAKRLQKWQNIEAITLADSADNEIYDPYFFLSMDVYYNGAVPEPEVRRKLFSDAAAFESSNINEKDRFLLEDFPVRIEYKDKDYVESVLSQGIEYLRTFRRRGTYGLYRLKHGHILYENSNWIEEVRKKLKKIPNSFWELLLESFQATMEHYLGDLIAAEMREDNYFFLISSAGFIRSLCSILFILNKEFEPSGRRTREMVLSLERKPENFHGRFDSFLRQDAEFTPARKRELAELLAKSVISMTLSP